MINDKDVLVRLECTKIVAGLGLLKSTDIVKYAKMLADFVSKGIIPEEPPKRTQ